MNVELEFLFGQARSLLKEQVDFHLRRCNVVSVDGKTCLCPGIQASVTFLETTEKREVKKC
jgi:hypothetical protein